MKVFAALGLILLLSACSDAPTETKKEPEKPPAPVTAQSAFLYTYPAARSWAGDSLPLTIRSVNLADVPSDAGKIGGWEITYVSASQQAGRIFTWSAVEAPGPMHKGIFGQKPQPWNASSGQQKPFMASEFHTDSPKALEIATDAAKDYLERPGTKPAVNFLLEFTPRFPDPVWRVMWGENPGSARFTAFVDATTGELVGKE